MGKKRISQASTFGALLWHLICGSGVPTAFWVAHHIYSVNLVSNTDRKCSYLKAVGRGLLGLFAGAFVFGLGAICLGAPVGLKYMPSTINWSLLMSLFTFSPAAAIFGASWLDWQRIFATTRLTGYVDYMVCLPAHGCILGSWFGAWPMPLDWERPWQEWPISVMYGALVGYGVGMIASFLLVFADRWKQNVKVE